MADPESLSISLRAWDSSARLGSPERDLALANAVLYVALGPKSNASIVVFAKATSLTDKFGSVSSPQHIIDSPNQLKKDLGFVSSYGNDLDYADGFLGQKYFPVSVPREEFHETLDRGFEQ